MAAARDTVLQLSPDGSPDSETSPEDEITPIRLRTPTEPSHDSKDDLQIPAEDDDKKEPGPPRPNNENPSGDPGANGRKFAAISTLAPLVTTLATFIAFGTESSARVSWVFYVINIFGILLSILGLRQEVLSRRKWGLDMDKGVFAKALRERLEQVQLSNFEMLKSRPPERPKEGNDLQQYEKEALRYRYECRKYCQAARRSAFVAKYYFSSMNDKSYVSDQLKHVAGAEEMVTERVIHLVDELLGQEVRPGAGYWYPYNLWRLYRGQNRGPDSACLKYGGNLEKSYAKLQEIDYSLGELRFTLKSGPNMENAMLRFQALERMTKGSTAARATLFIILSQLCLNVSTVLGGSANMSQ